MVSAATEDWLSPTPIEHAVTKSPCFTRWLYNLLGIENKIHDYFTVQQARSELLNLHHELKFFYFRPFGEQTGRLNWNSSGLLSGCPLMGDFFAGLIAKLTHCDKRGKGEGISNRILSYLALIDTNALLRGSDRSVIFRPSVSLRDPYRACGIFLSFGRLLSNTA